MFDSLSARFDQIFTKLKSRGRLGEKDVNDILREIRVALLEADVNLDVVKIFTERVKNRCIGADLSKSLSPAQQVIKIVNEELVEILGGQSFKLNYASKPPTVILLAGLQGAGKTTTAGKLALWFKQQGRNPLLVGADLARPAAVEQLRILAGQAGVSFYSDPQDPVQTARGGLEYARDIGKDVLIVDTAGRLSIDYDLMEQVRQISTSIEPDYTFLVIDAMIGQESVETARAFHETLKLDGVILTKLDGDARGGAALSVKEVVGKPIAFVSTGEKQDAFDIFHPDRMADRILGMGDVLTLIEQAERSYDQDVAAKGMASLQEGRFTLEDFLEQMQQVKKLGSLQGILGMLPGVPKEIRSAKLDDKELSRVEAIIQSMTPQERRDPTIINGSRKLRIANGSGSNTTQVNTLLKQFKEMQKMMKGMCPLTKSKSKKKRGGRVTLPSGRLKV